MLNVNIVKVEISINVFHHHLGHTITSVSQKHTKNQKSNPSNLNNNAIINYKNLNISYCIYK